ncbi:unnamed protein product [Adineta ricciae]|uniref:F-box domain-containing protein n=1 Tax=Adineta ricciae TaxID=249248 RepID=A0A814QHI5_ADIRI|nr:unnamed protein product [Adineta ricciae]
MVCLLENLSNEIFYEIFDYLDGCELYHGFSNLNSRFHQLLNSPLLFYELKSHCTSNQFDECMRYINPNQIRSFNVSSELRIDKFFSSFNIDSSLHHLRSIFVENIKPETLSDLLTNCTHLPCLTSLNIMSYHQLLDLCQIYPLIFNLSTLKSLTVTSHEFKNSMALPYATESQQTSKIEHMNINHRVTFQELATIISYTPKLFRLEFLHEDEDDSTVELITPTQLSNITHISMTIMYLNYDDMDIFLHKLPSTLESFNFFVCEIDISYLDFSMWEELIKENFPQLKNFYFNYTATIPDEEEFIFTGCVLDQFVSPFWIARQWFNQIIIRQESIAITIKPHKKRWYECLTTHSKLNINESSLLSIQYTPEDQWLDVLYDEIEWVTDVATIYHLEMTGTFFIGVMGQIFNLLPDLHTFRISSITLPTVTLLTDDELEQFIDATTSNRITKVYLEKMNTFDEFLFLIDLFPRLESLQIGCKSDIDIELFLHVILIKINSKKSNLRLLAMRIPTADDHIVKKIQNLIDLTITRANDTIFLRL